MGCELADAQVSGQQIVPHASSHWRLCVVLAGGIQNELERDEKRARAGRADPSGDTGSGSCVDTQVQATTRAKGVAILLS